MWNMTIRNSAGKTGAFQYLKAPGRIERAVNTEYQGTKAVITTGVIMLMFVSGSVTLGAFLGANSQTEPVPLNVALILLAITAFLGIVLIGFKLSFIRVDRIIKDVREHKYDDFFAVEGDYSFDLLQLQDAAPISYEDQLGIAHYFARYEVQAPNSSLRRLTNPDTVSDYGELYECKLQLIDQALRLFIDLQRPRDHLIAEKRRVRKQYEEALVRIEENLAEAHGRVGTAKR